MVLALALLTGCGSRLSQDELIALNPGTASVVAPDAPAAEPADVVGAPVPASGAAAAVDPAVAAPTSSAAPAGGTVGGAAPTPTPGTGGARTAADRTAPAAPKTDNQPITICSVSEMGGPAGAAIAQGVNGLQAWVGDVNSRGGVHGHRIRLIVRDSNSDPNVALSHVRACVENDGAVALVGGMATLTAAGYRSYLESKRVPSIGGDCGTYVYNSSPVFFNQCAAPETSVWAIAQEAAKAGTANKKFAFLYCQEASACANGRRWMVDDGFARRNGLDLAYAKQFSLTQLDFTSECTAMKAAGVTVVSAIVDPSGLQRMGQSCARQGFNPVWVQLYASVYADTATKPGLGNIRLQMPTMPFCCLTGKDAQNAAFQRYLTSFERYGGLRAPGPAVPLGWTSGVLFERFLDEVAKVSPTVTSAALLQAADGIKKETLGGLVPAINLTAGEKTPDSGCWFVMEARNGGPFGAPDGLRLTCRPR
ncbi:hypothetical protein GCM10009547_18570 [Sporichthya brevicatena]|uniref:Leucine-binding protein domain-containing protein n=1 Tax=Sporichthya brevicatena TaxID=171442 RepID=A0ABN1GQQ3_9ACTN